MLRLTLSNNIYMNKSINGCKNCIRAQNNEFCTSQIRLFKNLPVTAQQMLAENALHKSYKKDEIIVNDGMPINSILIVQKGRIKTCRFNSDGQEQVLDVLHDGQAIWHGMFLKDSVYHYSVVCLTDVNICVISRESFEKILSKHPEVAMSLITMLSTELDDAEEKAMILGIRDPKKRLAKFLLHRDYRCIGDAIHLKLEDIAGSVGLRPETVSRCISYFEKAGYLERMGQGKIKILDRAKLQEYSS